MPELPEVETVKNFIQPKLLNKKITKWKFNKLQLRERIDVASCERFINREIRLVRRRAKYIIIQFDIGFLLIHLGMSGTIKWTAEKMPELKHDHWLMNLNDGSWLYYNDPRRFGILVAYFSSEWQHIKWLKNLGLEPLSDEFDGNYLFANSRTKSQPIKNMLLAGKLVCGLGNIYVCESLFRAKIRPERPSKELSRAEMRLLGLVIKEVIAEAIEKGGTTLKDFSSPDGNKGYFVNSLDVYGRAGLPCHSCSNEILHIVQGGRASFYCPNCQN